MDGPQHPSARQSVIQFFGGFAQAGLLTESPELERGLSEYRASSATDPRDTAFYIHGLPIEAPVEVGPPISSMALESTPLSERLNASQPSVSSDLSHVLFMLSGPQYSKGQFLDYVWPGDPTAPRSQGAGRGWTTLYEYIGAGNTAPSLIGVDNKDNGHLISQCGTVLGHSESFTSQQGDELYNAISMPDGSRIFFTVSAGPVKMVVSALLWTNFGRGKNPPWVPQRGAWRFPSPRRGLGGTARRAKPAAL